MGEYESSVAGANQADLDAVQSGRPRRRTLRWLLGEIHLWAGLILFLPLVLLGISGSYLVYHDEIDGLLSGAPDYGVTLGDNRPAADMIAAARGAAPAGFVAVRLS